MFDVLSEYTVVERHVYIITNIATRKIIIYDPFFHSKYVFMVFFPRAIKLPFAAFHRISIPFSHNYFLINVITFQFGAILIRNFEYRAYVNVFCPPFFFYKTTSFSFKKVRYHEKKKRMSFLKLFVGFLSH